MIRSALMTVGVRGAAAGATFGMHFLMARLLGASGTGVFFMGLGIARGGAVLGQFGLEQSVVRVVAPLMGREQMDDARRHVATAAALALSGTLAVCGVLAAAMLWVLPVLMPEKTEVWDFAGWFVWVAAPLAMLVLASGVWQAMSRPVAASIVEVVATPALTLAALFTAVALGRSEMSVALAGAFFLAAALGSALIAWKAIHRRFGGLRRPLGAPAGLLLRASHPLLVASVMTYLVQYAPLLMLGGMASLEETGAFSVAQRFAMALSVLLAAVNNVIRPRLAVAHAEARLRAVERELRISAVVLLCMGAPVIAGLALFGKELLALMGEGFTAGWAPLMMLLGGQLANLATASSGAVLAMTGNARALRRNTVLSAMLCVALSAVAIPLWGALGAAAALAAAMGLQGGLAAWMVWRLLGVSLLPLPAQSTSAKGKQ